MMIVRNISSLLREYMKAPRFEIHGETGHWPVYVPQGVQARLSQLPAAESSRIHELFERMSFDPFHCGDRDRSVRNGLPGAIYMHSTTGDNRVLYVIYKTHARVLVAGVVKRSEAHWTADQVSSATPPYAQEAPKNEGYYSDTVRLPRIPGGRYKKVCYHGSQILPGHAPFTSFDFGYSEANDAVWVTPEEDTAEEYASEYRNHGKPIVYRVLVDIPRCARIDMELFRKLQDRLDERSLRDMIPALEQAGFSGWTTTGGVGSRSYEDVAMFGDFGRITQAKIMNDDGHTWGPYRDIDEVLEDFPEDD